MAYVNVYYQEKLDLLEAVCLSLGDRVKQGDSTAARRLFKDARYLYKEIEFIIEYRYPHTATKINGAPLPESEPSANLLVKDPVGFQMLEPLVFDAFTEESQQEMGFQLSEINAAIAMLKNSQANLSLNNAEILDALRLNIYRMVVKGISGFDAPIGNTGILEAKAVLETTKAVIAQFPNATQVVALCQKNIDYLSLNNDFIGFDRATFLRAYLNPFCQALKDFQDEQHIPYVEEPRAVNVRASHLFANNAFDKDFFAPSYNRNASDAQIALGKLLFFDARLSKSKTRSCASCHKPELALTDGMPLNMSLDGQAKLLRNTPSLWNAALQPAQFYDSRIAFLEDQVHDVVANKNEMNGNLENIVQELATDKKYRDAFMQAYGLKQENVTNLKRALASYVRSLVSFQSDFDRFMRGDEQAMDDEQVKGFNLFMGKAKCATCHFVPLFNGTVAPYYEKIESEVLGVPNTKNKTQAKLDADLGKFNLYGIPYQKYAFKTVGLRNVALTAPYMHNGVYNTLEEVVDFYEDGGGAGLGISLDNQTLAPDKLNLADDEKKAIVKFLSALTDIPNP